MCNIPTHRCFFLAHIMWEDGGKTISKQWFRNQGSFHPALTIPLGTRRQLLSGERDSEAGI